MAFVAGPRQVGKTTLAKRLPGARAGYLSWDIPEHREQILAGELPPNHLWVFDEIHKFHRWRGFLKGLRNPGSNSRRSGNHVTGAAHIETRFARKLGKAEPLSGVSYEL